MVLWHDAGSDNVVPQIWLRHVLTTFDAAPVATIRPHGIVAPITLEVTFAGRMATRWWAMRKVKGLERMQEATWESNSCGYAT